MDTKELYDERVQLISDVINLKPHKRVPIFENLFTWKIFDSDLNPKPTLLSATTDWKVAEAVVREHHERYCPDLYKDLCTRNNNNVAFAFGKKQIPEDPNSDTMLQVVDNPHLNMDEYDEFIADGLKFAWLKGGPRSFPNGLTVETIEKVMLAMDEFSQYSARIDRVMEEEYGIPRPYGWRGAAPVEGLYMGSRGIKGFSMDMRRVPEKLEAYNKKYMPAWIAGLKNIFENSKVETMFGARVSFLAHTVMNNRQFERFIWPSYEKAFNICAEYNRFADVFIEGDGLRLADFFNEAPKNTLYILSELDDPLEMHKAMPDIAIGGYPLAPLAYQTPEDSVELLKKYIDEIGWGYMFSTGKMLSFKNDAKRENLMAVYDYMHEHTLL